MKSELIEQYADGGKKLERAVAGMSREQLMAVPVPGKWSTHQVVIHLADAETVNGDRIRRIVAMDNPPLMGWDENEFLKALHYEAQSTQDAVTLIDLTRRQLGRVLRLLPDEYLQRVGQHSERGQMTLKQLIELNDWHLDHHLKFIAEKREKLGIPF